MTKLKSILVFVLIQGCLAGNVNAQGCSDAGFCTINSFKPNHSDSLQLVKHQLKVAAFFGKADLSISAYGSYLEYNRQLNRKWGLDVKLTSIAQNGNGISTYGLSDIFINANYRVNDKIHLTLGSKIPLSDANKKWNSLPLPMDYQASLGTYDLIIGFGYEFRKIQFAAALQQPLTQNNNQFIASDYPVDSELRSFQSTNQFERSGDVLLRVSYPFNVNSKLKFTPSVLPIYHLSNDKYTDLNNLKREITGSKGLTLNANIYLDYQINRTQIVQLNIGMPFIVRDVRPDGLTRSLIANLEYRFRF